MSWKVYAGIGILIVALVGGFFAGRALAPTRTILQPIEKEILKVIAVPGQRVEIIREVPGPIQRVPQVVFVDRERIVTVTQPVTLPPAELEKARREALRRFILSMEIPADTLLKCAQPKIVEGGIACGHSISFNAEILEPAVGVFVPVILPGEIARPVALRVEAKPDVVSPVASVSWRWSFGATAGLIYSGNSIRAAAGLMVRATRGGWEFEARGGREWGFGGSGYWGTAFVTYRWP